MRVRANGATRCPLADVARAATSEIEQYSRVVLSVQPGIAVIRAGGLRRRAPARRADRERHAVLAHGHHGPVSGHELTSGGVLIEITRQGDRHTRGAAGRDELAAATTPVIDVSVSRHMGLFAVARLAERHGVQVRLRPASPQGLTALVWLPDTVIERTALPFPAGGRGRPGKSGPGKSGLAKSGRPSGQAARQHALGRWTGHSGTVGRTLAATW